MKTDDAKAFIAGLILGNETPISSWYIGLIGSNHQVTGQEKASDLPAIEFTGYSEVARPEFVGAYADSQIDNLDSKAKFTVTQDKRIYGAFIVSSSAKGGNGGLLLDIHRYPSPRDLSAGTEYTLSALMPIMSADL